MSHSKSHSNAATVGGALAAGCALALAAGCAADDAFLGARVKGFVQDRCEDWDFRLRPEERERLVRLRRWRATLPAALPAEERAALEAVLGKGLRRLRPLTFDREIEKALLGAPPARLRVDELVWLRRAAPHAAEAHAAWAFASAALVSDGPMAGTESAGVAIVSTALARSLGLLDIAGRVRADLRPAPAAPAPAPAPAARSWTALSYVVRSAPTPPAPEPAPTNAVARLVFSIGGRALACRAVVDDAEGMGGAAVALPRELVEAAGFEVA